MRKGQQKMDTCPAQKMTFSNKELFSKCDQIQETPFFVQCLVYANVCFMINGLLNTLRCLYPYFQFSNINIIVAKNIMKRHVLTTDFQISSKALQSHKKFVIWQHLTLK